MALGLFLASGTAVADDIAWDLVNSTSQNLVSYGTDAPVFTALGDGFQKFDIDVNLAGIPYALLDDTAGSYPADLIGIIDSSTDHEEFFGICDTVNPDNVDCLPYHATWVFDISSASGTPELWIDLAAMGDFEATGTCPTPSDFFEWSWQVDGGPVTTMLTATVDEANDTYEYTMADGTIRVVADPLVVAGVYLSNHFTTFTTPVTAGSQLTVILTAIADGGSEAYAARNIKVTGALGIFADGFETGDTSRWTVAQP